MDKNNLELFKQAVAEGFSNKIDSIASSYTEEIVCSEQHEIAMRTIIHGKIGEKTAKSLKTKRIIAILIAAALLLTSCGIIFRNEIRDIFESIYDFFVAVSYTEEDSDGETIEEIYKLGYVPEGYSLEKEITTPVFIRYKFTNQNGDYLWFEQTLIDGTDFVVDSESGYTKILDVENYEIYYRSTDKKHFYIWNDGKYSIKLSSSTELSNDIIISVVKGIVIK